ncbi:MAG: hypothetical protein WCC10_04770 [Tumebacillaceae bacterium]
MGKQAFTVITLLGSGGGVARAMLTILNRSVRDRKDPIHHLIRRCVLYLIDHKQKDIEYYRTHFPNLQKQIHLLEFDLGDTNRFREHLRMTGTGLVIDVSWADTAEMIRCCNEFGVRYANTALENVEVDLEEEELEGFPLIERYLRFEEARGAFTNTSAIICSGMNPGVVQWMAWEILRKNPKKKPLGIYIVEEDTSFFRDTSLARPDTVYTTWTPELFLDEAILSYPMLLQQGSALFLYEYPYELEFKVRLGKRKFYGTLMPHEESLTLGKLLNVETGFIYRVSDHTTKILIDNLDDPDVLWDRPMEVLDPLKTELRGRDMVGVLVVYEDHERYMYNLMSNRSVFGTYGTTNATYFQVACGLYAAVAALLLEDIPLGVHYVDELLMKTKSRYGRYLQHYMREFVVGKNKRSDGTLLKRMRSVRD